MNVHQTTRNEHKCCLHPSGSHFIPTVLMPFFSCNWQLAFSSSYIKCLITWRKTGVSFVELSLFTFLDWIFSLRNTVNSVFFGGGTVSWVNLLNWMTAGTPEEVNYGVPRRQTDGSQLKLQGLESNSFRWPMLPKVFSCKMIYFKVYSLTGSWFACRVSGNKAAIKLHFKPEFFTFLEITLL